MDYGELPFLHSVPLNDIFPFSVDEDKDADLAKEKVQSVPTLADLSTRAVARHLPFGYVKRKYFGITDFVTKRIMFWSFPRRRSDILRYQLDCNAEGKFAIDPRLFQVSAIIQVGFCVQGIVSNSTEEFYVALVFDRCCITKMTCSCREKNVLWCIHATILAVYRFDYGHFVEVCVSISNNLNPLNRDQLQKLLQYLVAYFDEPVPGLARTIQNEISNIRRLPETHPDASDAIASEGVEDIPSWFYDEGLRYIEVQQIERLLEKIPEMIVSSDKNGVKILKYLTEKGSRIVFDVSTSDKMLKAWTFALASPFVSKQDKGKYCELLGTWPVIMIFGRYQLEIRNNIPTYCIDEYVRKNALCFANTSAISVDIRSFFLMPLCAGNLHYDDENLKRILSNESTNCNENSSEVDIHGELIWREDLPTSCVRVRALELSGCHLEAQRLAMAVARAVKDQSRRWKQAWKEIETLLDGDNEELAEDIKYSVDGEWMNLSLVAHRVNPLEILFNSLANANQIRNNRYYQAAVETLIVIFSQQMVDDIHSIQVTSHLKKWMTVVCGALRNESACKHSSEAQIDGAAIKDIIESLLDAGIFTSCGNSKCLGTPNYDWCLLMTEAIKYLDCDLSAKFALSCLRNTNKISTKERKCWLENTHEQLLCFTMSASSDHIIVEALEIFLERTSVSRISNVLWNFLNDDGMQTFKEVACKINLELLFDLFLQKLNSSLHSSRKIRGNSVLDIAYNVGFGQVLHLLKNWEKYILPSESIPMPFDRSKSNIRFSKEEIELLNREEFELAIRLSDNQNADKAFMFHCLKNYLNTLSANSLNFTEELREIKRKMFEIGLCCVKTESSEEFFFREMACLVFTEDMFSSYHRALENELRKRDNMKFPMETIHLADKFQKQTWKYGVRKLIVKFIKIPIGCKITSETSIAIDHQVKTVMDGDQVSLIEASDIVDVILENVKDTLVLYAIVKRCYESSVLRGKKPDWLKRMLEATLSTLEDDTSIFGRSQVSPKVLANRYTRVKNVRTMLQDFT